jgi:hypothetical protein
VNGSCIREYCIVAVEIEEGAVLSNDSKGDGASITNNI